MSRTGLLFAVCVLCAPAAPRLFGPEDLWAWRNVESTRITAGGERVMYVEMWSDRARDATYSNLWEITTGGKDRQQITSGNFRDRAPEWSPDGASVAFLSERDGKTQIRIHRLDSGRETALADGGTTPQSFAWSPDGAWIAFTAPGRAADGGKYALVTRAPWRAAADAAVFVAPVAGGAARQVSADGFDCHGAPSWTMDGKSILIAAQAVPPGGEPEGGDDLYEFRVADSAVTQLTSNHAWNARPTPSPDGSKIAFLAGDAKRQSYVIRKLFAMNADGGRVKVLSGMLDRDVREPHWSSDSRTLYFLADDQGATHVYAARADGTVRQITTAAERLHSFSLADNGQAAAVRASAVDPSDAVTFSIYGKAATAPLTAVNAGLLAECESGAVEEIRYPSSGGQKIQGWIVKPPQFDTGRRYPLVVETSSGAHTMAGVEFRRRAQIYAGRGYVVLYVNAHGSSGYGEEFGNTLPTNFPDSAYDDLMHGVDYVLGRGYIDTKRMAVVGGLTAAWAIGHTNRFAAAVADHAITDWTTHVGTAKDGYYDALRLLQAMPWEEPERYERHSPLFFAGNFKTPTLVLAGEKDPDSEALFFALQAKKVQSALMRVPQNGSTGDEIASVDAILAWLGKFI
ncbi:MAG TPA: prolyl oligopeptidase family serine peptidase [Bryobacteraceae bacterium]|nr:prolyl oligopeptidase family serine peptidase [Bryobacteraceae bacterium]